MKISKPQIVQENNQITYRVDVESIRGNETLWYSLHESYGDLLSKTCDAPLVALLIPAMAIGEDIHINGMISERLLYNLSVPLQKLLQLIIPSLHQIKIHPEDVCCDKPSLVSGVATGFSGGIDSYCLLADHYYSKVSERFKITHLLFNNVGSHGSGAEQLFRERYERLVPVAELLGLPFLMINSNLDSFYDKKLSFQQTHTIRNASVALLLQGGIGRYMYGSAYHYSDAFVGPSTGTGRTDNITLPLLSTDTLDAFSVGGEYTRVEKTLRVAELLDSYKHLDVCVNAYNTNGYTNCSTCWKCLRTLATLEIAGCLERYSASFDLNAYKSSRVKFFATLLGSNDPLPREIVQFAKDRKYSFPVSSHIIHASGIYPMMRFPGRVIRKLKRLTNNSG
ncbi:MAG: hypothetical protein GY752_01760 [bacterium]|nr:hypothetical protein [bacterium]MCP4799089.1 hypothetical protein [bacterium]